MTEQQYETILGLMADKISELSAANSLQAWQIDDLKKKLQEAERHLTPTHGEQPKALEIR